MHHTGSDVLIKNQHLLNKRINTMAITYTWSVDSMSVMQTPNPDYVVIARWTCAGTDGVNEDESAGHCRFESQQEPNFIPYADLTEEIVMGWINEQLGATGIANVENNISDRIEFIVNPPVQPVIEPVPWS
tara:strand:+ start:180 stop:572 length:393 start_codon:yes stop_codon:yes gene_type:complete